MTSAAAAPALLDVEDVSVDLGGRPVLRGVGLSVSPGEVVGLIGPNGAGKSTLLRAITGIVPLRAGAASVLGRPVAELSRSALAKSVAVVQQLPEAPAAMLVAELALLGRTPHLGLLGREGARDFAAAAAAVRRAGCAEFAERPLGTLSGGQRRRAFIARALAQEPQLLLLDEPTANLDAQAQGEIFALLRALAAEGVGVLVVVHDLTLAAAYCDRVVLLADGRVIGTGTPATVITTAVIAEVYGQSVSVLQHPDYATPIVVPAMTKERP